MPRNGKTIAQRLQSLGHETVDPDERVHDLLDAHDALLAERATLVGERDELLAALDEALTAIDEVESEPGAGTIFKIDWQRGLKLVRDRWLAARKAAS